MGIVCVYFMALGAFAFRFKDFCQFEDYEEKG